MKYFNPYLILLLFIPLLSAQCESNETNKIDYQGKLKYFPNQFGVEHFIEHDNYFGAYTTLPECFIADYSSFSLTDRNNFFCSDKKVYFSLDIIPKKDINNYTDYFKDTISENQEGALIMRDYCIETRAEGLSDELRSIYTDLLTHNNTTMHLGSVTGKEGAYGKELFYQFGVVTGEESYYILQAIMSSENTPFLYNDILEIFKSFRIKQ